MTAPKTVIVSIFDVDGNVSQYTCDDPIEVFFWNNKMGPADAPQPTYYLTNLEVRSVKGFHRPEEKDAPS
jgi:hypothetical protein